MDDDAAVAVDLPANFFTVIESKKWNERKEGLDELEKATAVSRIIPADFTELVRVLKKTVSKDNNIVVATAAAKCLSQLASGLGENFAPYSVSTLVVIFEKFKEKKPNVVSVLRDASDAAFIGTNLEEIYEQLIPFLENKNPQTKSEICLFLERIFAKYPVQVMNKRTLRPIINALVKTLSDMDATVRDNSALAIGTAMKVTGEKIMMTLIADVEPIKITKIKEFCEKAVISQPETEKVYNNQPPTNGNSHADLQLNHDQDMDGETELDPFDLAEAVAVDVPINFYTAVESKKWNERKEALDVVEKATAVTKIIPADFTELVRVLKKTVSKDNNIVVATVATKCLSQLASGLRENFAPYAISTLVVLFDKFKEKKPNVVSVLREAADAAFIGTNIEEIHEQLIPFLENKNPQIKSEMCLFLERLFAKYPVQVMNKKTLRPIINALAKTLSDMDATVRDNSALAIGTAMKVTGEKIMMTLIADVEPIKITKIKEFCDKAVVKKLPKSFNQPQVQQTNQPLAPPKSSATMVRSVSGTKLKSKVSKPVTKSTGYGQTTTRQPAQANGASGDIMLKPPGLRLSTGTTSSATVRRTATIVKPRASIVPKPSTAAVAGKLNGTYSNNAPTPPVGMSTPVAPTCQALVNNENVNAYHPSTPSFPTANSHHEMNQQDILYGLIGRMSSQDFHQSIEAFEKYTHLLSSDSIDQTSFKDKVGQIVLLCSLQLRQLNSIHSETKIANPLVTLPHTSACMIKAISDCVEVLSMKRILANLANNPQPLSELIVQTYLLTDLCCTTDDNQVNMKLFDAHEDEETVLKSLQSLATSCVDSVDNTRMIDILTRLLMDYNASPLKATAVERIKNAIVRSLRLFERKEAA